MLITLISATIFVLLAGFNVWSMLATPSFFARNPQLLIRVHRIAGYIFAAIFVVLSYFMLLRIKGYPDELPPRILVHMCLALMVAPLLIAKIVVARKQKAARGLLSALGVSLFVVSFLLVALNVFRHFLSKAATAKVATSISAVFIAVSVGGVASLFLFPHRVRKPDSDDHGPGLTKEPASDPHTTTMKLVRIQPQTDDAKTLRFLVQPGRRFSARPGQFLTFDWTIAGKQICRSYSICSSSMQTVTSRSPPRRLPTVASPNS
jgi:tellurite resistance protein TehA-like permease